MMQSYMRVADPTLNRVFRLTFMFGPLNMNTLTLAAFAPMACACLKRLKK